MVIEKTGIYRILGYQDIRGNKIMIVCPSIIMNKEFIKKMIKAKVLEYEAFKGLFRETVPEKVYDKFDRQCSELKDIIKETVFEMLMEEKSKKSGNSCCGNKEKKNSSSDVNVEGKTGDDSVSSQQTDRNRKINVDFD